MYHKIEINKIRNKRQDITMDASEIKNAQKRQLQITICQQTR